MKERSGSTMTDGGKTHHEHGPGHGPEYGPEYGPGYGRVRQRGFIDGTLPRLLQRAVVAQAILILVLVWGYAGWRIRSDRIETLESARHELTAIAAGMYVHMQAVLNDSLGAARAAAQAVNAQGGIEAVPVDRVTDMLARELSSGDYVRALFIATPNRFVSAARNRYVESLDAPPPWLRPALAGESSVFVGTRVTDPIEATQHAIPIAVHITDASGATLWVGALLGVEALDRLYENMAIRDSALTLVASNGDLLLRVPSLHDKDFINLRQTPAFKKAVELAREQGANEGIVEAPSAVAKGIWVYAVRRLRGYRMSVSAGREKEAILQPWRARTGSLIIVLAGVSVLFLTLTALLRHFIYRLQQANTNLGQLNTDLESRVAARTIELQDANQQLALTNQELEAFTASASHDLRSPLGTIAGTAGLLRDDLQGAMTDTIRQRIERIQAAVTRSSEIIDGLLSLARISRQELLNERVDLSALARPIIDELRQQYPQHLVDCTIEPKLIVNADPRLMKSLLGNLLGNAWKYTSKTPAARVELSCAEGTGGAVLSVRDNGAGFDMASATRIFEPFQRMHSSADFPGVGIGLATVARIVQRYSGKITVESAPGKGTTFRFTLPGAALVIRQASAPG